ncbi:MAG: hypothetical protein U9N55_05020 [candidate division Zixibacteria bacterium]|nr:hypothetical protein [candidate division Zixibacteria bacterium]
MKLRNIFIFSIATIAIVAIVFLFGCNGPVSNFDEEYEYQFNGLIVKDYDHDTACVSTRFSRNDTLVIGAIIAIDSDTLAFPDSTYYYYISPADSLSSGSHDILVKDSSRFNDTLEFTVPGSFSISSVLPSVKGPSDIVSVSWTGAANADGYIIAAVKQDSTYMGLGYSQWVTSQTTSTSINDSAFTITTIQGTEPNPGIYSIYVYAYNGVLDSTLLSTLLPTPIPNQLEDNITKKNFNGTIGSIVTTLPNTVNVLAQ